MSNRSTETRAGSMLIGGDLRDAASGKRIVTINPANEEVIGSAPDGGSADIDAAVAAGVAAFAGWAELPFRERGALLLALAERIESRRAEIVELEIADSGLTRAKVEADVSMAQSHLRYFANLGTELKGDTVPGVGGNLHLSIREPFGVVGRIVPFNHPFQFATSKLAAPIMAGNAIVMKPAEQTPMSATVLAEMCADLFPPGVVNIVTGGAEAGSALVRHPAVRRLAFIGSPATGLAIQREAASVSVKQLTLELGGKNPFILFPDADLDAAARAVVVGMNLGHQGQSCGSTTRLFLHDSVYDQVIDQVVDRVSKLRVGDPSDPATEMGPMNSQAQLDKTEYYIKAGLDEGAELLTGGSRPDGEQFSRGYWIRPTIFGSVTPEMTIFREEIFGPVLSVIRWTDVDDVIRMANSVDLALTAAIWTRDLRTAFDAARRVEAGFCWINGVSRHFPGVPFGGVKNSGLGTEEGLSELISYTQAKMINVIFD